MGLHSAYTYPQPNLLHTEDFSVAGTGTITNTDSGNGLVISVTGGQLLSTCAHTSTSACTVANNHWLSNYSYNGNIFTLIINCGWTDANPTNAQHESGFGWDMNNRIYYGNNSADSLSFISIKTGGVDQVITSGFSQKLSTYVMLKMNRNTNRISFFRHDSIANTGWYVLTQDIDSSAMSIPNTAYMLFFETGAEQNTRSGGDTGFVNGMYAYDGDTNIDPTTLPF